MPMRDACPRRTEPGIATALLSSDPFAPAPPWLQKVVINAQGAVQLPTQLILGLWRQADLPISIIAASFPSTDRTVTGQLQNVGRRGRVTG
jgi:hypothetical protein